jgi:CheY-like chemotaxis protein
MKEKENMLPINILLVDDSPGDVRLTIEALKEHRVLNNLYVANDGIEALEALHKTGKFKDVVRPDIILLDLNMPRMDGREVLKEIKANPKFRSIPVVILTTSEDEQDIYKSYDGHANCCITKPVDFTRFMEVIRDLQNFWISIVKLPSTTK